MKKNSILYLIISFTVLFAYAANTMLLSLNESNAIITVIILALFVLWVFKNDIRFNYKILGLILCSIIIVIITLKPNLISLTLFLTLAIISYHEGKKINQGILLYYLILTMSLFLIVSVLYFIMGFNLNNDISIWRIDSTIYRKSLGFSHPNQATMEWLGCALCLLSFANNRNAFKISILTIILSLLVYHYTQSRTSIYIICTLCIYVILFRSKMEKIITKKWRIFISIYPILCFIISYLIVILPYNFTLDSLLSGRIRLYKEFYNQAGITLLGNSTLENAMFDNSYLQALLAKGLIFTVLVLISFYALLIRLKSLTRNDFIIIFGFFSCGLTETMIFKFELLLLIICVMYRNNYFLKNTNNGT